MSLAGEIQELCLGLSIYIIVFGHIEQRWQQGVCAFLMFTYLGVGFWKRFHEASAEEGEND